MRSFFKIYANIIRKYINKPKSINLMHDSLKTGYSEYNKLKNSNTVNHKNKTFKIIKFKTPIFVSGDNLEHYIEKHIIPHTRENDILTIAESVLAITQGNAYRVDEIIPSKCAYFLYPWVSNVTYGTGLGMAETMQCAINIIGVRTILKATFMGAIDRIQKKHGSFYRIAGPEVKSIDFKKEHPIPFKNSHNYIVLSPSDPYGFCSSIFRKFHIRCAVMDANNVSVDILGYYPKNNEFSNMLKQLMKGNPAGQEGEKTSIIILREQ